MLYAIVGIFMLIEKQLQAKSLNLPDVVDLINIMIIHKEKKKNVYIKVETKIKQLIINEDQPSKRIRKYVRVEEF